MKVISHGKLRGIQQCPTSRNTLSIFALANWSNLHLAMNQENTQTLSDADFTKFNIKKVKTLSSESSAELMDPEFAAAQCNTEGELAYQSCLIVALESGGHSAGSTERLNDWNVKKNVLALVQLNCWIFIFPKQPQRKKTATLVREGTRFCIQNEIALFES